MFEAGALVYRIQAIGGQAFRAELQQADDAAKKATKSVAESAKSTETLGKENEKAAPKIRTMRAEIMGMSDEAKRSVTLVGSSMVGVGAAIIAVTALTVKAAVDWESAWAGVTKTVDGTDEELAGLQQGLRDLAGELPAAHSEIAAVAEAAGQLGIQTKNVAAFTRTMIDLGQTTNLSAQTAATELARFMNVMGTSQDKVSNLGSAVVELGNNYATTEAEIVSMAQRLSGAGRQVGFTEGEVLGLATALSSVGIEAEAGGSAFSKVLIDISASVAKGGSQLETYARVSGLTAEQFANQWRTEPSKAMAFFVKGLANAEIQGQSTFAVLESLGISEVRMRDALLRSAAAADQFSAAMGTGNRAFEENNALQTEAAKRYETTASQLQIMTNNINDVAIDMGSVFLPAMVEGADAVSGFARFLAELPQPLKDGFALTTVLVGGIVAFRGALMLAVPKIIEFRAAMATLSTELPTATSRLKGVMSILGGPWGVAIAVAAGGTAILVTELEKLLVSTKELQGTLKTSGSAAVSFNEAMGRKFVNASMDTSNAQLARLNEALIDARENWNDWTKGISVENQPVLDTVRDLGRGLAELATTDLPAAQRQFQLLARETDGTHAQLWALLSNMPEYRDALEEQAATLGINVNTERESTNQKRLLELATVNATEATLDSADAYLAASDQATDLRSRLEELISTILKGNDVGMDAVSANTDYAETIAEVTERIAAAQAGAEGYELGISDATAATRASREALVEQAKDAQEAAKAQFDLTSNVSEYRKSLEDGRQALIDHAIGLGATAAEAEELADQIFRIPDSTEWELIANTLPAVAAINGVISAFDGRQIMLRVGAQGQQTYSRDGQAFYQADGGKVQFFNDGGEHHIAQFARAGDMRVWAEPETGGEYYIPASPAKRARSTKILGQAANEFGYELVPIGANVRRMADGGALATAPTVATITYPSPPPPTDLSDRTIERLANAVTRNTRMAARRGDFLP